MINYRQEPVLTPGVVHAAIGLATTFGLIHWSAEQMGAVFTFTAAFFAVLSRSQVTPNAKLGDQPNVRGPEVPAARKPTE